MKIQPVGPDSFRTDRWTDGQTFMTKLTVTFCCSVTAPKKNHQFDCITRLFFTLQILDLKHVITCLSYQNDLYNMK